MTNINWVFNQTICIVMVSRIVLNIREKIAHPVLRFSIPAVMLGEKELTLDLIDDSQAGAVSTQQGGLEVDVRLGTPRMYVV